MSSLSKVSQSARREMPDTIVHRRCRLCSSQVIAQHYQMTSSWLGMSGVQVSVKCAMHTSDVQHTLRVCKISRVVCLSLASHGQNSRMRKENYTVACQPCILRQYAMCEPPYVMVHLHCLIYTSVAHDASMPSILCSS